MGLGRLISKGIGLAIKHGPRIGKAFGQITEGARKFGTIVDAGRKFGQVVNSTTGGKIGQSKIGRDLSSLADKADQVSGMVASEASVGKGAVDRAVDMLKQY